LDKVLISSAGSTECRKTVPARLLDNPVGQLLFNVPALVAESESDLIRARTREGGQIVKAKGRLRGKQANSPGARKPPHLPI
jgi:DNA invertase Pin-like site-specific DNA recombinase